MIKCEQRGAYLFDENSLTGDFLRTLQAGEKSAITSRELQALFGITARDVRLIVERCRRAGIYIVTSDAGYFYPTTTDEVQRFLNRENAHLLSLTQTLQPLRKFARELDNELKRGDSHG